MIVFGGYYKSLKSNKIFEYKFENNYWKEVKLDDEGIEERLEELKKDVKTIKYFGEFKQYHSSMNEYDIITDTMMETCTNFPRPRTNHTAAYYKHGMYIFGGSDEGNNKLNDLWKFDLKANRWIIVNHISSECEDGQPTKRSGHACNVIGNKMYIFGGLEGITHETNDFYCFDFDTENWITIQLKVSNPEELRANNEGKESLNPNSFRDERKKSLTKAPNMSFENRFNLTNSPLGKHSLAKKSKDHSRNNRFLGAATEREKYSKTFYNSPLRALLTNIVISKKVKDEEVEVNSPTTLALKSSIFLKTNDGFDHAVTSQKKKKHNVHANADIKKTTRQPMMIPCPRDGATLTACGNYLVVFGGDRYQMAFNDIYVYRSK